MKRPQANGRRSPKASSISCSARSQELQHALQAPCTGAVTALPPPHLPFLPRCVALNSYMAHGPDELELQKGEGVRVFGKDHDGWLRGMSLVTGRVGIFPSNYVAPLFRSGFSYTKQNIQRGERVTCRIWGLLVPTEKSLQGIPAVLTKARDSLPGQDDTW